MSFFPKTQNYIMYTQGGIFYIFYYLLDMYSPTGSKYRFKIYNIIKIRMQKYKQKP